MVTERMNDGWFCAFEYKSQEKFSTYGPKSLGQYIKDNDYYDANSQYDCGVSIKLDKYLDQKFDNLRWDNGKGEMTAEFENHPDQPFGQCTLAAIGKDGKIYSNDPELLKALGLKPKPNKIFNKACWNDDFLKYKVGDCLGIPEYGK